MRIDHPHLYDHAERTEGRALGAAAGLCAIVALASIAALIAVPAFMLLAHLAQALVAVAR